MKTRMGLAFGLLIAAGANAAVVLQPTTTPFTDIRASGTSVGAIADDSESAITAAALTAAGFGGNALLAGGVDILVGNNGAVLWNANLTTTNANQIGYSNVDALTMVGANASNTGNGGLAPRQFLMPLWDDHFPSTAPATSIQWQVIGGNLLVQWTDEDNFAATGAGNCTWQMIVYGAGLGPNGQYADYVYQDTFYATGGVLNDGAGATIAYKDWGVTGQGDAQWSFNTGSVSGYVESGGSTGPHALMLVPAPGSLALLGLGGLLVGRRRR